MTVSRSFNFQEQMIEIYFVSAIMAIDICVSLVPISEVLIWKQIFLHIEAGESSLV